LDIAAIHKPVFYNVINKQFHEELGLFDLGDVTTGISVSWQVMKECKGG